MSRVHARDVFGNRVLWSGMFVGDNPAGLKLPAEGTTVTVVVYGETPLDGDLRDLLRLREWSPLGGDEDLPGFYRFAKDDPILAAVRPLAGSVRAAR